MKQQKKSLWTAQEITEIFTHSLPSDWSAKGVSIDSRTCREKDIFIALKGQHYDGHDFIRSVLKKNAALAIAEHNPVSDDNSRVLVVRNSLEALYQCAIFRRANTKAKIVAVTGSVGKTTTKEMIFHVLSKQGLGFANPGNFNNHIGMPLSLMSMPREAKYGVFEIGMNHAGEIAPLTKLLRPHIAVVTNVAGVHLCNFRSVKEIAKAKAEIFDGLEKGGIVILNADNPYTEYLISLAEEKAIANIITFGSSISAHCRIIRSKEIDRITYVEAQLWGEPVEYRLHIKGQHQVYNALIALAIAKLFKGDVKKASKDIETFKPIKGRGAIHHLTINKKSVTVIDESYNANPTSVEAAIDTLTKMTQSGKKIAVLGDMLELGTNEKKMHRNLKQILVERGINKVFCVGKLSKELYRELPVTMQGGWTMTSKEICPILTPTLDKEDIVLIKGSHSLHMEKIVRFLLKAQDKHVI